MKCRACANESDWGRTHGTQASFVIPAKFSSPAIWRGTHEGMKIAFSKEAGIQLPFGTLYPRLTNGSERKVRGVACCTNR